MLVLDVRGSKEWSSCVCLRRLACSSGPIDERGVNFFRVLYGRVRTIVCIVSNLNLATSRSCFEDYTYILGAEELLLCDFGPDKAVDKSLIFIDCLSMSWDFLHKRKFFSKKGNVYCSKVLKNSITMVHLLKRGSIRVYVPTLLPFLERGIVELVFWRAAYVPLTRMKPSRSYIYAASIFTRPCRRADRLDRGDCGWVSDFIRVFRASCSIGFGIVLSFDVRAFASADDVESSFLEVFLAEGWSIFVRLRFSVAQVAICLNLCSARKHRRDCFWHPQIDATLFGVGNLTPRWYVDGTACRALSHGVPRITL